MRISIHTFAYLALAGGALPPQSGTGRFWVFVPFVGGRGCRTALPLNPFGRFWVGLGPETPLVYLAFTLGYTEVISVVGSRFKCFRFTFPPRR